MLKDDTRKRLLLEALKSCLGQTGVNRRADLVLDQRIDKYMPLR